MSGPRTESYSGVDSTLEDQLPSVMMLTESSRAGRIINERTVEESSKLQLKNLIGWSVRKKVGRNIVEGLVKSYSSETELFKIVFKSGYFEEIRQEDLLSCLAPRKCIELSANEEPRNTGSGGWITLNEQAPPSRKSSLGGVMRDMPATHSENGGCRGRRPLMMRAINAGGICPPRKGGKGKKRARTQNAPASQSKRSSHNSVSHEMPTTDLGTAGRIRTKALRIRAENACDTGDSTPRPPRTATLRMRAQDAGGLTAPRQESNHTVQHTSRTPQHHEEDESNANLYYNPSTDNEDDEDSDAYWDDEDSDSDCDDEDSDSDWEP